MTERPRATTAHGRALGALLGNAQPDPTGLPGFERDPDVLFETGEPEVQVGIREHPLAVFERERGQERTMATLTHEADAERYLVVQKYPRVVSDQWETSDRFLWPADVRVEESARGVSAQWRAADGDHQITTTWPYEARWVCCVAWVRNVTIEELMRRALAL